MAWRHVFALDSERLSFLSGHDLMQLRSFAAFSHLEEDQEKRLLATTRERSFDAGESFLEHTELSRDAYLIAEGRVDLKRNTSIGDLTLARLGPGEIVGEMSFLESFPRSVTAETAAPTRLLLFDHAAVRATIEEDPVFEVALYWAFWKSLSSKLRATNEYLLRFFEAGEDRVHSTLVKQAEPVHVDVVRRREVLRELALSNMEVNFFASLAEAKKLEPGQRLFVAGDEGSEMFLVVSGRIMISQHIPGAGEEALTFLERGQLFGEMALIDQKPRNADARATDDGEAIVLAIRKEVLNKVLDPQKASSIRLLRTLCSTMSRRVRDTNEKLVGWYLLAGGKVPSFES